MKTFFKTTLAVSLLLSSLGMSAGWGDYAQQAGSYAVPAAKFTAKSMAVVAVGSLGWSLVDRVQAKLPDRLRCCKHVPVVQPVTFTAKEAATLKEVARTVQDNGGAERVSAVLAQ